MDLLGEMAERAPDGIVISALDGTIRYANPAFRRLLGHRDTLVGEPLQEMTPAGEARVTDLVRPDQDVWQGTLRLQRSDGTTLIAEVSAFLLRDTDGRAAGQAAILREANEQLRGEMEPHKSQELLKAIVDNSKTVIFAKDRDGRYLLVNKHYEALFHIPREQVCGKTDHELFPAAVAEQFRVNDQLVMETGTPIELEEVAPGDDGPHTYISIKFPIYGADGAVAGVGGIATDITDRKRAEQAHAELQQQIIEAQQASLRELSTPLIPLAEGVLVMPLVGSIDSARARQIMETLLQGISAQRARIAIMDVTGVKIVDAQVADTLLRAAQAAKLLGAEVILTGIGPSVAMSIVQLGVNLGDVLTLGTLQSGIAYAFRR